jgi:hypothetical protein
MAAAAEVSQGLTSALTSRHKTRLRALTRLVHAYISDTPLMSELLHASYTPLCVNLHASYTPLCVSLSAVSILMPREGHTRRHVWDD